MRNRIDFKIKTGSKLELLSEQIMGLLASSKKDISQDKDGEQVPKTVVFELVLIHCNVVNNAHQQASKVLFTFLPNKQLITIRPQSLTMLKTTNAEYSFIKIWFTNQNNRPLEIEDNVNITLAIGADYESRVLI